MRKALTRLAILATGVLALTGFVPVLQGQALSGYALLAHTVLGALLALAIAGLLLLTSHQYGLKRDASDARFPRARKLCFMLMGLSTLALILPLLAAMIPLLGTHGQHVAISAHRYAALLFLLSGIGFAALNKR